MDRTSWKPKVFKATESVDYKVNEVNIERGGSSMKIDGKNVIKIWESFSGWYWYAIEDQGSYTGIGADGNEVQAHAWYGYVQGMENEWGTWDSNELERAGVWTVPKSNWGWTGKESKASENWKDVANKFYKEELNKGKKSAGEGQHGCPFCGVSFGGSFVGHVRKNHTKEEFTQLQNDGWIPERSVYGESKANEYDEWGYSDNLPQGYFQYIPDHTYYDLVDYKIIDYREDLVICKYCGKRYDLKEHGHDDLNKHLLEVHNVLNKGESKADDIRNAIAQDHEQWRKKQEPEQARQFLNNYQIPLSNKQSDYYPYDWGNQNNFSEDGFALSDTLAKNQGQSWQKGGEAYFVEWGYDLDYDFEEVDDINEAKQLAKDNGGNVYLDNKLVYSVIPSIKKDPTNDKSSFTMANNLMGVESKASEYDCESCGGEYSNCPHCGHGMHDYEWEDSNDICDSCEKGKYDESYSGESSMNCTKCQTRVWDKNGGMMNGSYNEELDGNSYTVCGNCGNKYKLRTFESYSSEGFNQGLHGYVDAKCKTCGVEFDSIPDMDDHYAMNSDHISNLDDLDSKIPNSD